MKVSTKKLQIQFGMIIDHVVNGEEVTVTHRGKALAKIVPIISHKPVPVSKEKETGFFGMWTGRDKKTTVDSLVREIRGGRAFWS